MGGKMSRNKGARGEREFIAIMQEVVDEVLGEEAFEMKRNLFQTREGGADIAGAPEKFDFFSVEVKRQEKLSIPAWLRQTVEQAQPHQWAILAYRQSREEWHMIMIEPETGGQYNLWLDEFLAWFKTMLIVHAED